MKVRGSIHQGHHKLRMDSRHRQCPFIILSIFICNHHLPARCWTPNKIDEIINFGNSMYSHALTSGSIPNTRCLLVSDLPVVAKSFDSSLLTIKYRNEHSGFFNGSVVEMPCTYSLSDSLVNDFSSLNDAILLLDGYMTGIMKNDSEYFFFDSHERDQSGMPVITETGAALLIYFKSQHELEAHIFVLANKLRVTKFEIVPIKYLTSL